MFHSCYFYNYLDTAYKSPHFPFLTLPILLVPYFVPPSNLLGTFYIKVNRLKNLFKYEVKNATSRVTNCNNATLRKIKLDRLCIMHYQVDVDAKASLNTKITVYFDETFADIPFATITDNNSGTSELANPVLDWATTTQVTMSNFASGFSLMVIGYI